MFIRWNDPAVRLTGRWTRLIEESADCHVYVQPPVNHTTTTAPGSYFELAFRGESALLQFELGYLETHAPHLWIQVDGGASVEVPVDRFIRINAAGDGSHVVKVSYKGGVEQLPRWYAPLMGAISFIGAEAEAPGELPPDDRTIIEFIGDSITEGVLTDIDYATPPFAIDQLNRPYQDDNAATYASLTAKALNLRPIFQAYGAVGLTRAGCGSVPRAGLIYPYCYDGVPYAGEKPAVILINHGANDRGTNAGEYITRYAELIDQLRANTPDAVIVCLTAFCGAFDSEVQAFVSEYNRTHEKPIHCISSKGWVPLEPLHPLRDGHRIIADHLTPLLKEIIEKGE